MTRPAHALLASIISIQYESCGWETPAIQCDDVAVDVMLEVNETLVQFDSRAYYSYNTPRKSF